MKRCDVGLNGRARGVEPRQQDPREMVVRGAEERLSPIMMTALTTGLALVPLIASGKIPGQEIEYPMGLVILSGLATATLVNLIILPVVCSFTIANTALQSHSMR